MDIKQVSDSKYIIHKHGKMRTNAELFLSSKLMKGVDNDAIQQITNVATLPGIIGNALAMPDMHSGYGFPIGGVAGFDYNDGIVSPGGIGFDINCGIRFLTSNTNIDDVDLDKNMFKRIYDVVPSGVGRDTDEKLSKDVFDELIINGIDWAINQGIATKNDKNNIEDLGKLNASNAKISQRAVARGRAQIGTLGSGNHFLELQYVESILDETIAKKWHINKGDLSLMIHTGSRGFGHQIATDFVKTFLEANEKYNIDLVDPQLACVPINSKEGQDYLNSMGAAANFAYVNRQMITHKCRNIFSENGIEFNTLYDVAHNIAKFENYVVDGHKQELLIHRKGATRALSKGNSILPNHYKDTGQPVIIPGSMGSYSYLLVGTNAENISFGSVSHGAGRTLSRSEATKTLNYDDVMSDMNKHGVSLLTGSKRDVVSESRNVYKDVSEVVDVLQKNDLAKPVVRLKPIMVIKG